MDVPLDLDRANRAELIRLVVQQGEQIAALEQAQVRLRAAERIVKHLAALFVFVANPAVSATNNAAGSATKMTLASLFGTWRLQGCRPLEECRAFLAAPQL